MATLFILAIFGDRKITNSINSSNLSALYPISLLRDTQDLFDPQNTESTWEYYLLENLSCGLVRDSKDSATGYVGCLAESFYQTNQNTWVFKLRNLKWSDGSSVTNKEIESWISRIRHQDSRHIQFFKKVETVSYNETNRELQIQFSMPVGNQILHELSLADAGLFPTDYKINGWQKTIGPFFVKSWKKLGNQLILSANRHSSLYHVDMPHEVELKQLLDPSQRPELFKSIKIDFAPLNPMTIPDVTNQLTKNAPNIYLCHPTLILYFSLNSQNPLAKNHSARANFSQLVDQVKEEFSRSKSKTDTFEPETQMIPSGFQGRLKETTSKNQEVPKTLSRQKLKIRFFKGFNEHSHLYSLFTTTFRKANVDVEYIFSDDEPSSKSEEFATLLPFMGNQKDPSGSWSFLLFSPEGPIHPWLPEIKANLEKLPKEETDETSATYFQNIHREVLEKNYVVPFLVGSQRYLLSDRVDASGWNRFDSRVRFYELKMK